MKIQTKLMIMASIAIGLSFAACKKNAEPLALPADEGPISKTDYLPTQIGSGKSKITFSYTKSNVLSKITYGNGSSIELQYTKDGIPYLLSNYEGDKRKSYVAYVADAKGRIIRANEYVTEGKSENATGHYQFNYNTSGDVNTISFYDIAEHLKYSLLLDYDEQGNVTRERNSVTSAITDYSYDDRKGLLCQAEYVWLFALEDPNIFLLSRKNNLKSGRKSGGSNQQFSYTYNNDQYPSQVAIDLDGNTQKVQVEYRKLE